MYRYMYSKEKERGERTGKKAKTRGGGGGFRGVEERGY